jgi:hypothetical protein
MIILTANLKTTPRRTYVAISGTPPRATPRKGAEVLEPAHAILPEYILFWFIYPPWKGIRYTNMRSCVITSMINKKGIIRLKFC